MKKTYRIEVDCANCAAHMEEAASKVEGVQSVSVNFMLQKMMVEFEAGANAVEVMNAVSKACRKAVSGCVIDCR